MNAKAALELIRATGIYGLCGTDGCLCANFSVHGIEVDISCRKSDGAMPREFYGIKVRVHSSHIDSSLGELRPIADEVVRQLRDEGYAIMVRYCDYRHDSKQLCVYCDKPRGSWDAYLCEACKANHDIVVRYEFAAPATPREEKR